MSGITGPSSSPTSTSTTSSPSSSPAQTSTTTTTTTTTSTTSTSATDTSTSTTTTSSSASSTPLSTSSTTSSSTTSSVTATSSSTTSATTTQASTTSFEVTSGVSGINTITRIIPVTPTTSSTAVAAQRDTRFFHNKGAVAGTFSAVGVVVLAILVFIATSYIRRRREKKYDAETDEVAAEAAAAGAHPDFSHDDYDYRSGNTNYGAYSETSHGTLTQAPLTHPDAYSVGGGGYPGDSYANVGAAATTGAAGAAGIGAGVGRARSQRSLGGSEPYHAFAVPQDAPPVPENYEMEDANHLRYRRSTGPYQYDPIIGGYASGGDDPYAVARGASQRKPTVTRSPSVGAQGLAPDSGYTGGYNQPGQPFVPPPMPQPERYQPPQQQQQQSQFSVAGGGGGNGTAYDAYGGLQREAAAADLPNPYSAGIPKSDGVRAHSEESEGGNGAYVVGYDHEQDEQSEDEEDDEDEPDQGRRVLRVANE